MENRRKQGNIYDARALGWGRMLLPDPQHMFAMLDATVLVPILVDSYFHGEGLSVQVALFMVGARTLSFHLCSKFKASAFLGSSLAFPGGFAIIAELNTGIYANMSYEKKPPYACGGIVATGLLCLILAAVTKLIGMKQVTRFPPPVATGPTIIYTGFSLVGMAISSTKTNWLLVLIVLCTVVIFNIWGKDMFRIIPVLMGVVVAYAAVLIFYVTGLRNADSSAVMGSLRTMGNPMFGMPPFQLCKFSLTAILVIAPITTVTMMEHVDDISAISITIGGNFVENPGLHHTLIGDGLATSLSAFFGGPANITYGENIGVLELSYVYDPRVIQLAVLYATLLSFVPCLVTVLVSLPTAAIGGINFIFYGMISAVGVRNVAESRVDLSNNRNLIIAVVAPVSDLNFSKGLSFTAFDTPITLAALAIVSVASVLLDAILPGNDYHFEENQRSGAMRDVSMKN